MEALGLFALVSIGGDGTLSIAQQLFEYGIPIVGVPKTIDNDLEGTLFTFGFDSAVSCATDALDRLHTTAESHNRVMVLEVMGRYAGWIALYAGVAGGADVILIPEIPFSYESVCTKIQERENLGKKFTIIIVAEGAREKDGGFITSGAHSKTGEARLGGIGAIVSAEIEKCTGKESRVCVLGHLQRGGSPTTFDRALCSIFGATAVELVAAGEFGKMVAFTGPQVGSIKISDAIGKTQNRASRRQSGSHCTRTRHLFRRLVMNASGLTALMDSSIIARPEEQSVLLLACYQPLATFRPNCLRPPVSRESVVIPSPAPVFRPSRWRGAIPESAHCSILRSLLL